MRQKAGEEGMRLAVWYMHILGAEMMLRILQLSASEDKMWTTKSAHHMITFDITD